jgi:hypothetical protein
MRAVSRRWIDATPDTLLVFVDELSPGTPSILCEHHPAEDQARSCKAKGCSANDRFCKHHG